MKKTTLALVVVAILISSCKKSTTNTAPGGAFSFQGNSYNVSTCEYISGTLEAYTALSANATGNADVWVNFPDNTLPAPGIYTVVTHFPHTGQVSLSSTIGTHEYSSTGGNGSQTVTVTAGNGKIQVKGSGITLVNDANGSDSSALNISLNQLD